METQNLLATISRNFFAYKKVNKYRMKKVSDMSDDEVILGCHAYCEENNLISEWNEFRAKAESEYFYCSYMEEYIDGALCYDFQMILGDCIKPSVLTEIRIDKEKCAKHCFECEYRL